MLLSISSNSLDLPSEVEGIRSNAKIHNLQNIKKISILFRGNLLFFPAECKQVRHSEERFGAMASFFTGFVMSPELHCLYEDLVVVIHHDKSQTEGLL